MEKKKILIVEDEAVIGMHIRNSLERLGYSVCGHATTGEDAIRQAGETRPDLILMDIVLRGDIDGIEAASIMRETMDIPIVYITGNADIATITRARATGPHGYVLKPVEIMHLFSAIDTAIHRHNLESSLRESEDKFRQIVETVPWGIAIHVEGKIEYMNPTGLKLTGLGSPEDVEGKTFVEYIHPDDRAEMQRRLSVQLGQGVALPPIQERVILDSGEEKTFEFVSMPCIHRGNRGIMVFFQDVTVRTRAEEAIRDSEERFRALVDNLQDLVFIMKPEGTVVFENPAAVAMLGYSMAGKNGFEFIHPDDMQSVLKDFSQVLDKQNPHIPTQFRVRRADGSWIYVDALASNLMDNSIIQGLLVDLHDVTKRVEAQKALQESEQRYHALFHQSPVGVIRFDTEYAITDCNERMLEIMKSTRDRLIGLDLRNLRERAVINHFKETLEGKSVSYEGSYRVTTSDTSLWIRSTMSPLRDDSGTVVGGIVALEDITDRKLWEKKLQASEERNRLLIEHAGEGIAVIQGWHYVFANPQFFRMIGYDMKELSARPFAEIIHPEDSEMMADRYRRRMAGEADPASYEVRFIDGEGAVRWMEINSVLLQWDGNPAALLFARDINKRKHAEEERRKMEAQIQQTQKLESLGVLAGGIAHDFNNLLMAILGNIDLAMMDVAPSSIARGNLVEAARASQRAADLCRQMLAYSGRGRFTSELLNLNDIVEEMGHMLEVSISKKAVLRLNVASGLPAIEADATQVRQIIMNLVINASDAIGERSGVLSVSTGSMECDNDYLAETWLDERLEEGTYVYVEVADTGEGMDHETLKRIFDPFFTTKFTGRGLGLAAVLGIVRGHRGAIKVYSEKGKGTTVKVLLPAARRPIEAADWDHNRVAGWKGSGTILLADDEESIRNLGRQMLERLGFRVVTASDGREAVDLVREDPGSFDCVILDLTMPHMDGVEAFREIRLIRNDIRVVISSGYNEQEVCQRFVGMGLSGFIQKPYHLADLSSKLRELFG